MKYLIIITISSLLLILSLYDEEIRINTLDTKVKEKLSKVDSLEYEIKTLKIELNKCKNEKYEINELYDHLIDDFGM